MTRKQRQALKRTRDKVEQLERRCDVLIRRCDDAEAELRDAEYAFRRAWHREAELESQNKRMMDLLTQQAMLVAPHYTIVVDKLPSVLLDDPNGESRG